MFPRINQWPPHRGVAVPNLHRQKTRGFYDATKFNDDLLEVSTTKSPLDPPTSSVRVWVEMATGPPEGPGSLGQPSVPWTIFWPSRSLTDRRRVALFLKTGQSPLSSCSILLLLCLTLSTLRLLLLMSGNVHPNPGPVPVYPCSVCSAKVTWQGKSIQCSACHKWVHFRCSNLSPSSFRSIGSSHSWRCPCCITPLTHNVMYTSTVSTPLALPDSSSSTLSPPNYTSPINTVIPSDTVNSCRSHDLPRTATFSELDSLSSASDALAPPPPHPLLKTGYPSSAFSLPCPATSSPAPSPLNHSSPAPPSSSDFLSILQWNAGGLRAKKVELLHYVSLFPPDVICIQESGLSSSSSFNIPGYISFRSDRTRSRSDNPASTDSHIGGGVVTFVRKGLSASQFSTDSLSSLDPYTDYVGVTIPCLNSSSLSFLNVYAPPIRPSCHDSRIDSFSPSILPTRKDLFILGDFNCHHPLWDSSSHTDKRGSEVFDWIISSDLLSLNDPDCPTLLHRSTGNRSSPDISLAPTSLALSCSWQVLQDLGSDHLPILLEVPLKPVSHTNGHPPSFNFNKARWNEFSSFFDSHCPTPGDISALSLSAAAASFTSVALNAAKSSIPFGRVGRQPQAWWSSEVQAAVDERRKRFATAHLSEEDRQAYISASRHASTVIAKAKTDAWHTTCSSLSPQQNPRSVYSLLRTVAGSSASATTEPNFPNCTSPKQSASTYACYLKSHFSVTMPKALRSRAKAYLNNLRHSSCPLDIHSSFCSPFSVTEFHTAIAALSSSTSSGPDRIAYPMLKHLPPSGISLLLHIFNLSWSSHTFPSIWKASTIIPIHKMGKPRNAPASFRPICLTSCVSKLFERMVLSRLLYFLESNSILSPCQAGFRPGRSTLDQILYLSQSVSDAFQSHPPNRTILATVDFSKAFDSVWHPALFQKLLTAGLPPCFVRWTQSFLSDRRARVAFKNHKSRSFRVRRGVPQGSVLGPVLFSLFINDLPASLPTTVNSSLYADDLAIWSSSPIVQVAQDKAQQALHCLERWSQFWCLPLNPTKCEVSFFSTDNHQALLQPKLFLSNLPLAFNPTPKFLGVTFDRTLSFTKHISTLKARFFPRLKAFRCISAASFGPSKESLSILYKAFLRPLLTYASPGWFPFLGVSNVKQLERLHNSACRVISGCLSSSPIPLLLLEASQPPIKTTLVYQSLYFYERALRLPPSFTVSGLAKQRVKKRLSRNSWRHFSSVNPIISSLSFDREPLINCPPFPPWNSPCIKVDTAIPTCSRSDPLLARQSAALSHLNSLPHHDLVLWTDGSVPFALGKGGSGVFADCSLCNTQELLSFSAGPVCSSFSAEAVALFQALSWTRQHLRICQFNSVLILSDSCSVLQLLKSSPGFLLPSTFWQIWHELSCLSQSLILTLQWVPGHSSLPGNDTADMLAKKGAVLPISGSCSLSALACRIRSSLFSHWRTTVRSKLIDTQVPAVSTEELGLPRHARCVLSRLRCNGHSLLLSSYLNRIGKIETSSCSACGHPTQDVFHLILHCPATNSLRLSIFGPHTSIFDLWSRPWGVARLLGLHGLPPCPHPKEGVG